MVMFNNLFFPLYVIEDTVIFGRYRRLENKRSVIPLLGNRIGNHLGTSIRSAKQH